jgi:SAM-dependent methyltransferase
VLSSPGRLTAFAVEERRIRVAYARRAARGTSHAWFSPGHVFQVQDRERQVLRLLARQGITDLGAMDLLEVGCGSGAWLRQLVRWGAAPERLAGVDLRPEAVNTARRLAPAGVRVECGNATGLPFQDESFDLVLQAVAFSSVTDGGMRRAMAAEMLRVLRREGVVLWYDFRFDNPRNPHVRGVGKREIHALFPGCGVHLQRITLAPPLVRTVARRSWLAAYLLARIPFLRTHYLGVLRKGTV